MMLVVERLAAALKAERLEALLIGGQALPAYGVVRQTLDIDCLAAPATAAKLSESLLSAGYTIVGQSAAVTRYRHPSPSLEDVDILIVDENTFGKMLEQSSPWKIGDTVWRVPSLAHLIALKLHALKHNASRWGHDFADIVSLMDNNAGVISRDEMKALCDRFGATGFFHQLEKAVSWKS
jgi:hypothetical protein